MGKPRQGERAARFRSRIGHRGAFLAFLAVLDLAYGWSLWVEPPAQFQQLDTLLDVHVWAVVWFTVGAVCAVQMFMLRDRAAYVLAAVLKFAWAGVFLEGWYVHHLTRGWVTSVIFAMFSFAVLTVGSWPEPPMETKVPPPVMPQRPAGDGRGE